MRLYQKSSLMAGFLCVCGLAMADPESPVQQPYGYGKMYGAFQFGYGHGLTVGNTGRGDANDVHYLAMLPSFGIGISDTLGADSWYRGNFDFVAEAQFLAFLGPGEGHSEGVSILLRYNFLDAGRIVPFFEFGVGAGYIDTNLSRQADGIAFYPQAGAGLNFVLSENWVLTLGYRYHHISNKGTQKPNTGINANVGLIGFEYHFD